MVTFKKVNNQNLCNDLMVENLKQARRIAALKAEVASLRINQQRHAKIADSIDAAVSSTEMTLPGLKLFCIEWSRQLRQ